jgi:rRNA maturation endonuclease Nob1
LISAAYVEDGGKMLTEKRKRVQVTGILTLGLIAIDDYVIEWINAADFNLPAIAKGIGIDYEHKVKATINIELVEEPCIICGKPVPGDKICQNCGRPICDTCAKTEGQERYCPICQLLKQQCQTPFPL